MNVIISQPRYLPAINYLHRLYFADKFVFLDNVQRQSRGWENRNKILSSCQAKWLTIPVDSSSRELIMNSKIKGKEWVQGHRNKIWDAYHKYPCYDNSVVEMFYGGIEAVLEKVNYNFADTLIHLLLNTCKIFGFEPKIVRASSFPGTNKITGVNKLVEICNNTNASVYISGPNGRSYGVIEAFKGTGIKVLFNDYKCPEYDQFGHDGFVEWLCFFDSMFNLGVKEVKKWIQGPLDLSY